MKRYYFTVTFLPKEANLALLMGRCVFIMHGFSCKYSVEGIGVSLPAWSEHSIGNVIAFIHKDENILSMLKKQGYFQDMNNFGFFKISDVNLVPKEVNEVRFKRNQTIGKMYAGNSRRRLKRLEKRALARGEVFNPQRSSRFREFDTFHCIAMNSVSNQQDFILHIQKEEVANPLEFQLGGYGFASNKKYKGTVPDLSRIIFNV